MHMSHSYHSNLLVERVLGWGIWVMRVCVFFCLFVLHIMNDLALESILVRSKLVHHSLLRGDDILKYTSIPRWLLILVERTRTYVGNGSSLPA